MLWENKTGVMIPETIYNYYEKVTDRYYVALLLPAKDKTTVKFVWESLARKVVIPGFDEFDFFLMGKQGCLELYEGLSGSIILRQCEMKQRLLRRYNFKKLIDYIPGELHKRGGKGAINQTVVNFIFEHNHMISPRYRINVKKV